MTDTHILNPDNLATPEDIARVVGESCMSLEQRIPGMYLPYPGFVNFGMYIPQRDINALHRIASSLYVKHGPLKIAEIGSFTGATTLVLANYGLVYAIDTWDGGTEKDDNVNHIYTEQPRGAIQAAFVRNVVHQPTIIMCQWHDRFWREWQSGPLDMVFIDGDHSFRAVQRDIEEARMYVKHGGILCGHDFSVEFPGVVEAVLNIGMDGVSGSVWWKEIE